MKKSKIARLFSLLLTLTLMLAMAVPAFAANDGGIMPLVNPVDNTGSITIVNNNGRSTPSTFALYRLLDYDYDEQEYTETDLGTALWGDGNALKDLKEAYKAEQETEATELEDLISWIANDKANVDAFGVALWNFLESDNNQETYADCKETIDNVADGESKAATDLPLGYYAIFDVTQEDGDIQGLVSLTPANDDVSVYVKPERATVDKVIVLADGTEVKLTDAEIGDEITFKITGTVPDLTGYDESSIIYKIVDTLGEGFDLPADFAEGTALDLEITIGDEDVTTDVDISVNDRVITFDFSDIITGYTAGLPITITYKTTLTSKATVEDTNKNTAKVEYTFDGDSDTSTETETEVYTYQFDFTKVADGLMFDEVLNDAQFTLQEWDETESEWVDVKLSKGDDGVYYPDESGTETLTFGEHLKVKGLADGKYRLVEAENVFPTNDEGTEYKGRPTDGNTQIGYYEFEIKITHDEETGEVTNVELIPSDGAGIDDWNDVDARGWIGMNEYDKEEHTMYVKVVNTEKEGTKPLPETGAISSLVLTAGGIMLMLGSAFVVFKVTRRKETN